MMYTDYLDYLFTIVIIALTLGLLVGVTFYIAWRLGKAFGVAVERAYWYEAQARAQASVDCLARGAPETIADEFPDHLPGERKR